MKNSWILLVGMICSVGCLGQEKWTYRDCIEYALENNLELKNFGYSVERQEVNYASARNNHLPSVGANSGLSVNQGRTVNPSTNQIIDTDPFLSNNYGIGADIQIFNGFRLQNQLKYEKYRFLATREDYKSQQNDITYLVLDAFVTHLINLGMTEIQSEQLDYFKKDVHRIRRQIELGLASGSELYEAEAREAADEFQLINFQNLTKKSENELKKLMNLPITTEVSLASIEVEPGSIRYMEYDSLVDDVQQELPQVKSMMLMLDAAKKQLSAMRASIFPSLSGYASMGTWFSETQTTTEGVIPFSNQIDLNRSFSYGVRLNIPIFNRLNSRNNIQRAKINYQQAENDLQIMLRDTEYDINEAMLDYEGAMTSYSSAMKKEKSMVLAFEVAEKKREKGLISVMDFYEAKNNLATARAESLRTKLQLFLNERTLNFYLTGSFIE